MIGVTYKPISVIASSTCKRTEISPSIVEEEDVIHLYFHSPDKKAVSFDPLVRDHDGSTRKNEELKNKDLKNKIIVKRNLEAALRGEKFFNESKFEEAIKVYEGVIFELSKITNPSKKLNKLLAVTYIFLGNVYRQLKNREQVNFNYTKAEELDKDSLKYKRLFTHPEYA